jgi:CubicO group peptidase (beta-lactamase class C family)
MDPRLSQWRTLTGGTVGPQGVPILEHLTMPLIFEPGTSWSYGIGIDWAGVLVMRLNNMTLEEYMEKNIWSPLAIKNITFHQELKPDVPKNLVTLNFRGGIPNPAGFLSVDTGKPVEWTDFTIWDNPIPLGYDYGGHGSIGSAVDYMEILKSILKNDSKLLKPETVDLMFTPQLAPDAKKAYNDFMGQDIFKGTFTSHAPDIVLDWGLAGSTVENDEATGRKKGTLSWSGLTNLLWTIDRETGLACFYASNILPFGDFESHRIQQMFEKEMYERLKTKLAS